MTKEEAEKVLEELNSVRPEQLKGEAKRLFEAIMKIADERDKTKQEYDRDTHILQNQLDLVNVKILEQNKIIDLMAIVIGNEPLPTEEYCIFRNFDCPVVGGNRDCKDCIKQYFENKAEELINR